MKHSGAKGHTKKHAKATKKHHHTLKHHPTHHPLSAHQKHVAHLAHIHAKAKHPAHAKARALSLGDMAVCGVEALAASLRLSGIPVAAGDVLALHRRAGADDELGAPIEVLLEAAAEYGLAGWRLAGFGRAALTTERQPCTTDSPGNRPAAASLILGLELPGPHAVLATPDGWWSWGELWCPCEFPDAVIEEAWRVGWSVAR